MSKYIVYEATIGRGFYFHDSLGYRAGLLDGTENDVYALHTHCEATRNWLFDTFNTMRDLGGGNVSLDMPDLVRLKLMTRKRDE